MAEGRERRAEGGGRRAEGCAVAFFKAVVGVEAS